MVRAIWNGEVIAESDDTVVVEGNHYFPAGHVRADLLTPSTNTSVCPWKGRARYHTIVVAGKENKDAAWFYPAPSSAASAIAGRIAFWHGVKIEDDGGPARRRLFDRLRRTTSPVASSNGDAGRAEHPTVAHHDHAGAAPVIDLTDATFFESLDGHATIVDFWAPWCRPCTTLHPIFDHLAHHHASKRVVYARVNVDQNPGVASRLGVMSIPTLVICDVHGNEVDRLVGLADAHTLELFVQRAETIASQDRVQP